MQKIRIAIIGFGGMGVWHSKHLLQDERYEISGLFDIDNSRYLIAKDLGITNFDRFHSYQEIAEDKNTDAVLIATPNDVHKFYVEYFAAAKKNIICEKPVAITSREYAEMTKICHENGVVFMVHQNRRWDTDYLTVKNICETGELGKITRIESRVQGGNGIPGDWRKFKETGGGMLLDWGVHLIDQAVVMFGSPETVFCRLSYILGFEVDDGLHLLLTYKQGITVEIVVETNCFITLPRWTVYGVDGTAVINDWSLNGKIVKPVYSKIKHTAGINAGNGFTKTMAYRTPETITESGLGNVMKRPPERAFYTEFYDVCLNGKQPFITEKQVMTVMRIIEAAFVSAQEDRVVEFKEG